MERGVHDERHHRIKIAEHILRSNPNDPDTLLPNPLIAYLIAFRPIATIMRFSIHLDGQPVTRTKKVQRIRPCRMLMAELQAGRALAQRLPQQHFRQGHLAA
jgi:hypothetical protein